MALSRRSRYDSESHTLKKCLSSTCLVPVEYDESKDFYRPWSRRFYRDTYYPDNDYFWYRQHNVGLRHVSYPGLRRLPTSAPHHDLPRSDDVRQPRFRWSTLDSVYSGWRRYYDTSYFYPYRWWSSTNHFYPVKTSDYSYRAFHPYASAHYPYSSKAHPYKFKPAPKTYYYDFLYL